MKVTRRQLRRIIREEMMRLVEQPDIPDVMGAIGHGKPPPREEFQGAMLDLDDYDDLRGSVLEFARGFAANTGYETEDIIEALKSVVEEI